MINLENINYSNTKVFDSLSLDQLKSEKLKEYFDKAQFDSIYDLDSIILPVVSFLSNEVSFIARGVYATEGKHEDEVKGRIRTRYRAIKEEMYSILCTDQEKYNKVREITDASFDALVNIITAAIVIITGLDNVEVAVVVAFILKGIIAFGKDAWCRNNSI